MRKLLLVVLSAAAVPSVYGQTLNFCNGQTPCAGKNPRIRNVQMIQQSGARPHFSPDGSLLVFDRTNTDGYSDVYLMKPDGTIVDSLTDGKSGITQKNNGNAVFDPSGQFIIFISEVPNHLAASASLTDPGMGMYCNLWATDLSGSRFWQLTNIPVKTTALDGIPVYGSVNPLFSVDGKTLVWTEHYAGTGDPSSWGFWRIKAADFSIQAGQPVVANERVLYTPAASGDPSGTYVTAMGFETATVMVAAGNMSGQNVYGMDEYVIDLARGTKLDLTNTSAFWEEGASVGADGLVVFMSNKDSQYRFDFSDPSWQTQPMTREYYLTDPQAKFSERLTYFNDASAPEYNNGFLLAPVAMNVSPDGRFIAGTIGVATAAAPGTRRLKIALIELNVPLVVATVSAASYGAAVAPDSIVTSFGSDLATGLAVASEIPWPSSLGGTSVTVTDAAGKTRSGSLYAVAPGQVSYLLPAGTATGTAAVTVTNSTGAQVKGTVPVAAVAPAVFTANASGSGVPAAVLVRASGGTQTTDYPFDCSAGVGNCTAKPINLGGSADQVVLLLFGTGIRGGSNVSVAVGNQTVAPAYAGPQNQFPGLDQINVLLPHSLAGAGLVNVVVTVNGVQANTVQIRIQ